MEAITEQLKLLNAKVIALETARSGEDLDQEDIEMLDASETGVYEDWVEAIGADRRNTITEGGTALAKLLQKPPPMTVLRALAHSEPATTPNYHSIPETPAPRRHPADIKLQAPQRKLELAMQYLTMHWKPQTAVK
jgi:hypothetical protein